MKISMNMLRIPIVTALCLEVFVLGGCAYQHRSQGVPAGASPGDLRGTSTAETGVLAGEWEYEESGMTITLILDRFGNGTYDFKDGRFMTSMLADRVWKGQWLQQENNREGEFEILLSADYREGEGHWWYTRIEDDQNPTKPGGSFRVTKNSMPLDARLRGRSSESQDRLLQVYSTRSITSYRQE